MFFPMKIMMPKDMDLGYGEYGDGAVLTGAEL
jgi:hypothetical protein